MTEITFTIKDSQAKVWGKMLGTEFDQDNATLDHLVKLATHRVICDIARRNTEKALAEMNNQEGEVNDAPPSW